LSPTTRWYPAKLRYCRPKALAKKADEVILATDPDREGEAIAWHIKEELKLKKPERIVFHEITKEAIEEALAPAQIDENLRYAQEARRVLDRLVGYDLSGLDLEEGALRPFCRPRAVAGAAHHYGARARDPRVCARDYYVITADRKPKKAALHSLASKSLAKKTRPTYY
jgi:hypothetical protein